MANEKISCAQARWLDLVEYLASLGHTPHKVRGQDYWYLSPLRTEREPSFKVNRKLNLWYDHGAGLGGTLLDFGTRYHQCSIGELLAALSADAAASFTLHAPLTPMPAERATEEGKISILEVRSIESPSLKAYLQKRAIPLALAQEYCKEVHFRLYGKEHTALGFQNRAGGYELRSAYFKGSSSPKSYTLISRGTGKLALFEGFFSFLSYRALQRSGKPLGGNRIGEEQDFLVLNSLAFLGRTQSLVEGAGAVHLYLDRDSSGRRATAEVLRSQVQARDKSALFKGFKDCNDYLVHNEGKQHPRPSKRLGF
ncbi:MAG TPA: toprim domain-containing protein [Chitinophagaceae bacterium]|jgi:hypothetical protein|nr:toprim domain-containing protein [Chitinophagaceae bacterium]